MTQTKKAKEEALLRELKERIEALGKEPNGEPSADRFKSRMARFGDLIKEFSAKIEHPEHLTRIATMVDYFSGITTPEGLSRIALEMAAVELADKPQAEDTSKTFADALAKMNEDEQKQFHYLRMLFVTDDAFGVLVRGHVLLESALKRCINEYVVSPKPGLYKYFSQKVRFAHMLGIIDKGEANVLIAINDLRNDVAHIGSNDDKESPDFDLTADHEKVLWEQFTSMTRYGFWPTYNKAKFPRHVRYVLAYLWLSLVARLNGLKNRRLQPVVDSIRAEVNPLSFSTFLPILMVKLFERATEEDTLKSEGVNSPIQESEPGGNAAIVGDKE